MWLPIVEGYVKIKGVTDPKEAAKIITKYNLPREAVPTELMKSIEVWQALLPGMPSHALLRNLSTLGRVGILSPGAKSAEIQQVIAKLSDTEAFTKARVHPMAILLTAAAYGMGTGIRGHSGNWPVLGNILDTLTDAFYAGFAGLPSTGQRIMVAVDVSGSMQGGSIGDVPMSPSQAAGAMALGYAYTEPNAFFIAFDTAVRDLPISKRQRLDDVHRLLAQYGGGTDCAAPIQHALMNRIPVDAFIILTDSETWAGNQHAVQALDEYRRVMNIPAKMVNVQMVYNKGSIADQDDPLSLDVVGLDGSTPNAIHTFLTM